MIEIIYPFVFLNDYINASRGNKYGSANIKKDATYAISLMLKGQPKIQTPCRISYTWLIKTKGMDIDNCGFAAKYVNDALVKAGLIENDNVSYIYEIKHNYEISKKVGVKIEVY